MDPSPSSTTLDGDVQAHIVELKGEVASLSAKFDSMSSQVESLSTAVHSTVTAISDLKVNMNDFMGVANSLLAKVQQIERGAFGRYGIQIPLNTVAQLRHLESTLDVFPPAAGEFVSRLIASLIYI